MGRRTPVKIGDVHGTRTVIKQVESRKGSLRYLVRCSCGLETEVFAYLLVKWHGCKNCNQYQFPKLTAGEKERRFNSKKCGTMQKYRAGCRCRECLDCKATSLREYRKTAAGRKTTRRSNLKQNFGLTTEQYAEILNRQDGKCAGCLCVGHKANLCVDHCHDTGKVRGLLCSNCNLAIGMFLNSPETLKSAAEYLESWKQKSLVERQQSIKVAADAISAGQPTLPIVVDTGPPKKEKQPPEGPI